MPPRNINKLNNNNMKISTYLIAVMLAMTSITASAESKEVEDFSYDWTEQTSDNFWTSEEAKPNLSVDAVGGLTAVNNTEMDNWKFQFHIVDGLPLKSGNDYVLKITIKGTDAGYALFGVGTWSGIVDCGFNFTKEWKEYSVPFSATQDNGFVVCQMGKFVGTVQIKSVKICHYEGTFSGGYMNFDLGASPSANKWDKKLSYILPKALEQGADYTLTMDVKADADLENGIAFWPIWDASPNKTDWGSSKDVQYCEDLKLSSEWTTLTWKFNANFTLDKFEWVMGTAAGDLRIDNVRLVKDGTDENLIENGDFSERTTKGWSKTGGNILSIIEGQSPSTGINQTMVKANLQDGAYYTLQGMKTNKPAKGIFIHNGKKVVIR